MSGCSGCGGRGHSPGQVLYGHILGCGTPAEGIGVPPSGKFQGYWSENKRDEQLGIIKHALQSAGFDRKFARSSARTLAEKMNKDPTFADSFAETFAWNLLAVIQNHTVNCEKAASGKCNHVVTKPKPPR